MQGCEHTQNLSSTTVHKEQVRHIIIMCTVQEGAKTLVCIISFDSDKENSVKYYHINFKRKKMTYLLPSILQIIKVNYVAADYRYLQSQIEATKIRPLNQNKI